MALAQQRVVAATTYVQQTTPRVMTSPGQTATSPGSMGPKPGQVEAAMTLVPTVHSQLTLMEDTIRALSEENQRLKERLLRNRRGQLEKFFMTSGNMLMQGVFGEWCRIYKALKAQRELDGLMSRSVMNREDFERRALELQQRIKELADLLNQARQEVAQKRQNLMAIQQRLDAKENENARLADKAAQLEAEYQAAEEDLARAMEEENIRKEQLALAEQLIAQFMEMSGNYKYNTNPVQANVSVPQGQQAGYIKDALHKILAETDTKYMAPITVGASMPSIVAREGSVSYTGTATAGSIAMEMPAQVRTVVR